MTAQEIIATIRTEIERQHAEHSSRYETDEAGLVLERLEDFLSDLEESGKPTNQGLDKEIEEISIHVPCSEFTHESEYVDLLDWLKEQFTYFYELGCRRTAEKYDELEYNRQRVEESEKPMNLEEEINRYLEPIYTDDIQFEPFTQMTKCARHFAKWGAEHLKK